LGATKNLNNEGRKMRVLKILGSVPLLCAIAGCVVGPTYEVPTPAISSKAVLPEFQSNLPTPAATDAGMSDLTRWWSQFDDPLVAELVAAVEASNPTLAQALARIAQARAKAAAAGSTVYPTLAANASSVADRSAVKPRLSPPATAPRSTPVGNSICSAANAKRLMPPMRAWLPAMPPGTAPGCRWRQRLAARWSTTALAKPAQRCWHKI
jgi:hypothetical protein